MSFKIGVNYPKIMDEINKNREKTRTRNLPKKRRKRKNQGY
jgi:hypothetical protein